MVDPKDNFAKGLIAHGSDCDSSCYNKGCMRDYSNMPYHPFLDWRLGLDVAQLCLTGKLSDGSSERLLVSARKSG